MIDIRDYIPVGRENAVTYKQIFMATGLSTRQIRNLISVARRDTVILNVQDGNGFFIPELPKEQGLVERWLAQEEHRLKIHALSLKSARKVKNGR